MPLEIIDYLPINDNLLVIVNSSDFAIFREASHSADSLLLRTGTLNASYSGIRFSFLRYIVPLSPPLNSYLLCDFFILLLFATLVLYTAESFEPAKTLSPTNDDIQRSGQM